MWRRVVVPVAADTCVRSVADVAACARGATRPDAVVLKVSRSRCARALDVAEAAALPYPTSMMETSWASWPAALVGGA